MPRFLADENLHHGVVRALRLRRPGIDIIRAQDCGLKGAADPVLLAWCAAENRLLLTHDVRTITRYAYERVEAGQPMPGVFEIDQTSSFTQVVEDILLIAEASQEGEWEGQVH